MHPTLVLLSGEPSLTFSDQIPLTRSFRHSRDKRFTGGFDPDTLEATLNSYASEGWRLVEAVPAANMLKTFKAEIVMILERDAPAT